MTVAELLGRISSLEFSEWMALSRLEAEEAIEEASGKQRYT